jgi:hypothetical protein
MWRGTQIYCRSPANPQKFGALNITAALGQLIMHHPEVQGQMEQFLMQHALPEYSSSDGYMRAIVSTAFAHTTCILMCFLGMRGSGYHGEGRYHLEHTRGVRLSVYHMKDSSV